MNSETCPSTSHVFCDTEVVTKLTEQHDGHTCCSSQEMLRKLKIGTKKNGSTYSVVPPKNPEWSIVRTKTERFTTFVHCKAAGMVSPSIPTCSLCNRYPWNGKKNMFSTGSSSNYKSILENGPWAGGLRFSVLFHVRREIAHTAR